MREAVAAGWSVPDRFGAVGHSMGGFITAGVLARYPKLAAAVLWDGGPCYRFAEELFCRMTGQTPPAELLERLDAYDPERYLEQIAPRPVLLIHGEADTVVPPVLARRFVEQARPFYRSQPDRLSLVEFPRLNHYVTAAGIAQMRQWFLKYL
jgi:dipeptidyl aminopeptidase/acylaminoacyl peptidase